MTFMVGDSQAARHARIRDFLAAGDHVISVILAAADFEWTVRRGILALGKSPNADIRAEVLAKCSGLDSYKDAWKAEVKERFGKGLPEVIKDWQGFKVAYELRHRLVHGIAGTTGQSYAGKRVDAVLRASMDVASFASANAVDLFARLPVRRRKIAK
jgi:hypothetical protein